MDNWESKLTAISGAVAAVAVPLAIAYLANEYTSATAERGVQGRFVELAVSILTREPTQPQRELRRWAASVLDRYSGVKLSDSARSDLVAQISLPPSLSGGGMVGYQGPVAAEASVRIIVTLDGSATGPAIVLMAIGGDTTTKGQPRQASITVAPGGSGVLDIETGRTGTLRVMIDAPDQTSGGSIQLIVRDRVIRRSEFRGDASFTFSVAPET